MNLVASTRFEKLEAEFGVAVFVRPKWLGLEHSWLGGRIARRDGFGSEAWSEGGSIFMWFVEEESRGGRRLL